MENSPMKLIGSFAIISFCLINSFPRATAANGDSQVRRGPAISIVDLGVGADGERRLSVQTDAAEITDLLKAVFKLTGDDFAIDQDVSGPVDIKIKNATAVEVFKQIADSAKPPLKIRRVCNIIKISRDAALSRPGDSLA